MASPGIGDFDYMGRNPIPMLEAFPVALIVGIILGYLAGLGVGGGSLLILWLTLVLHMDPGTARAINLMFFITAAGAVSILRWRKGTLQFKEILPAAIGGCCTAALFAWVSIQIDVTQFRKLFGILLLVTGVRELFYRPRKAR